MCRAGLPPVHADLIRFLKGSPVDTVCFRVWHLNVELYVVEEVCGEADIRWGIYRLGEAWVQTCNTTDADAGNASYLDCISYIQCQTLLST